MKIVMLESKTLGDDLDFSVFEQYGEFTSYPASPVSEVPKRIQDADIILVSKIPMNAATLDGAKSLKLICVTATGTNNIDFDYARKRQIAVTNAAGYSTAIVAQHTLAMYLYLAEKMRYYDDYVRSGAYAASNVFTHFSNTFQELDGKTWGIIGLGAIGRKTAHIAEAFGCRIIYYSTSGKNHTTDYQQVDFDTLLAQSDIISIHAPLTSQTENLMNADAFSKMKSSAILINVGRGPIVNEADLYTALVNKEIAGAGLDVLSTEPIQKDNPLNRLKDDDRLLITPHVAWGSTESRQRLMNELVLNIEDFLHGGKRNRVC